jgi:hypothetical protein
MSQRWHGGCVNAGMPTKAEILLGLARIAHDAAWVSIGWHFVAGVAVVALWRGARPQKRIASALLSLPLLSVAALAFAFDNPFNGAVFALLALALGGLAWRADREAISLGRPWAAVLGTVLVAFGWLYPHFLDDVSPFVYIYAAPFGVIPCPTLSVVIGAALMAGGLGPTSWRVVLAAAGAFYALFGALRLGVVIDVVLLAGAAGLMAQWLEGRVSRRTGVAAT